MVPSRFTPIDNMKGQNHDFELHLNGDFITTCFVWCTVLPLLYSDIYDDVSKGSKFKKALVDITSYTDNVES